MDIRCRKTTCEFNKNHICMAKEITINNKICCSSYKIATEIAGNNCKKEQAVKEIKTRDTSKEMFISAPKDAPFRNRKTINIDCKANCLFNINGICRANGISVNDLTNPVCMTYLEK